MGAAPQQPSQRKINRQIKEAETAGMPAFKNRERRKTHLDIPPLRTRRQATESRNIVNIRVIEEQSGREQPDRDTLAVMALHFGHLYERVRLSILDQYLDAEARGRGISTARGIREYAKNRIQDQHLQNEATTLANKVVAELHAGEIEEYLKDCVDMLVNLTAIRAIAPMMTDHATGEAAPGEFLRGLRDRMIRFDSKMFNDVIGFGPKTSASIERERIDLAARITQHMSEIGRGRGVKAKLALKLGYASRQSLHHDLKKYNLVGLVKQLSEGTQPHVS